jgi:hypothetical protein
MDIIVQQLDALSVDDKQYIAEYEHLSDINDICKSFIGKKFKFFAQFDEEYVELDNCNLVGDALETVVFKAISAKINIMKGPKQSPPDFWCCNKEFAFEQKCFTVQPGFDIANFESFIAQLCQSYGVLQKLFKTKYLVFEYTIVKGNAVIDNFTMLNIWDIVGLSGKNPVTVQNKRNMWYNIRPSSKKDWCNQTKTPEQFIDAIIKCIQECPNNMTNREEKINNIRLQFNSLKTQYRF